MARDQHKPMASQEQEKHMSKQSIALEAHRDALRVLRTELTELTKHVTNDKKLQVQEVIYQALISFDRYRELQQLKPNVAPRFTELKKGQTGKPYFYRDQS